jgi:hypothetical protein
VSLAEICVRFTFHNEVTELVTGSNLPNNLVVGEGETVTSFLAFRFSLIAFWLQTRVAMTDRRLVAQWPKLRFINTIPMGSYYVDVPLAQIASVAAITRIQNLLELLLGIFAVFVGTVYLTESVGWGIGFIIFGLWSLDSSLETPISGTNTDGETFSIHIHWTQRRSAGLLADSINNVLSRLPG